MSSTTSPQIKENPTFIFSCSGGSDAGEIADRAARLLSKEGAGKMFCLAGIGGRVDAILNPTRKAPQILVIDGCPCGGLRKLSREES